MNRRGGWGLSFVGALAMVILALSASARAAQEKVVYVDLEKPGETVAVPAGFTVRARLLAPGQKYRYKGAYDNWFTAETPTWFHVEYGEGCEALQAQMTALLASRTLPETRRAIESFRAVAKEAACPGLRGGLERRITELSPELHAVASNAYAPMELTMQRLNEAGQPVETWKWQIVAPSSMASASGASPSLPAAFEEIWIVKSVVENIAALTTPETAEPPGVERETTVGRYRIGSGDARFAGVVVDAAPFVWDPKAFVGVARAAVGPRAATAPARFPWTPPLTVLTTPTAANIHSLERRLRSHLSEFPRDARAHEASALALGVLGLRHSEGTLADVRPVLNRMTAHLALAAALRARPGIEGELAGVILDLLTGRERPAMATLTRLEPATRTADLAPWHRALWLRATRDWRVLAAPASASLLERFEYVRALSKTRGVDVAVSELRAVGPEAIPDWGRILLSGDVSVETANMLANRTLRLELAEAATVGGWMAPQSKSSWWWKEGPASPHDPIPDELWRTLIERSIANAILAEERHLLGLGDRMRSFRFREETLSNFAQSGVVSMLAPLWAYDMDEDKPGPGIAEACRMAADLSRKSPWRLSVAQWNIAARRCPRPFAKVEEFVAPWLPRGTLFDLRIRLSTPGLLITGAGANWNEIAGLPSYDFDVLTWVVAKNEGRDPEKRDFEKYRSEFGYNVKLLRDWRRVATSLGQPQAALEPARLACQVEPQECFALVEILRANGLTSEAFQSAEQAFERAGDSVAASHEADWVVDEYLRLGRVRAAWDLAERVAATGSEPGLLTVARLAERQGRYAEAQGLLKSLDERYHSINEKEFLVRRQARISPEKKAEIQAALARILDLDGGSEINAFVTEDWLTRRGSLFRAQLEAMGVKMGDVIDEVNGMTVKSHRQMILALTFDDRPEVTLTLSRQSSPGGPASRRVVSGTLYRPSYVPIR